MFRYALLICLIHASLTSSSVAVVVPVTNPSFEQPATTLCGFGPPITGWTVNSGGVWRPGLAPQCLSSYTVAIPDGQQVAFSNGGDIEQILTTNLAANTRYVLRVRVGKRQDCCQPSAYGVQLRAGAALLFQDANSIAMVSGQFIESTVQFATGAAHAQLGQALRIRLTQTAGQANYDHVRLESFPADCNSNGIFDAIDIANGTPDTNGNGVPDSCETLPCPADIAPPGPPMGNGTVNVSDLLVIISAWGACANPNNCPADIAPPGGNDQVNVSDLLAVISAWGACQ